MKGLILVIIIFLICAVIGYEVAVHLSESAVTGQGTAVATADGVRGVQHNLVIIQVDDLDSQQPRMVSAWFLSLFFVNGASPTVTLAQMYPTRANAAIVQSFERSFSLDAQGDPSPAFWKAVSALKIRWEGYILVDNVTIQKVMEWTNGPGTYPALLGTTQDHPQESKQTILTTCQSIGGIANRGKAPFEWADIVPDHFRSDLRMEVAITYWNEMTRTNMPVNCQVLLAP